MMRLQKYIALTGLCSRRRAEELIEDGEIEVNGAIVSKLGTKIDPENDEVSYRGEILKVEKKEYYMLNKLAGYTCTTYDPHAEKVVIDVFNSDLRLFPVGRLDRETEGLLLITNDGDFSQKVIHPSKKIPKEYVAELKRKLSDEDKEKLEMGYLLDGKKVRMAKIDELAENQNRYKIVIYQGRKRQIRRMIEKVGNHVVYLKRTRLGELELGDLAPGEYRPLTESEINLFN